MRNSVSHLFSSLIGESYRKDVLRSDAGRDKVGYPVGQTAGFARTGSGNNQNRPVYDLNGFNLLIIQFF